MMFNIVCTIGAIMGMLTPGAAMIIAEKINL